jgi:hypothetical protein
MRNSIAVRETEALAESLRKAGPLYAFLMPETLS